MDTMRLRLFFLSILALLLLLLLSSFVSCSSSFPAIFSFGDSIFDAGTNHFKSNCSAQADFPPYGSSFFDHPTGRFTNGSIVPDFISQFIGIDMQKPFLEVYAAVVNGSQRGYPSDGINFASAGSGLLPATNKNLGVISIQEQLQQFKKLVKQKQIDRNLIRNSLFLLESGSNDPFNYFLPYEPPTLNTDYYVRLMLAETEKFISQIYKIGARKLVVFSLGPVGCVRARTMLMGAPINRCYGKLNKLVKQYNEGLENLIMNISSNFPGSIGVYGSVYQIIQQYRKFPERFGFTDVSAACCGNGVLGGMVQCGKEGYKICKNPNELLFWDFFHPSEHTYYLISEALWGGGKTQIRPLNLKTLARLNSA